MYKKERVEYSLLQKKTPFADAFGYFVAGGKATHFGVQYVQRIKLPPPYNDCFDGVDVDDSSQQKQPIYYDNDYEVREREYHATNDKNKDTFL